MGQGPDALATCVALAADLGRKGWRCSPRANQGEIAATLFISAKTTSSRVSRSNT